ncbi:MAG: phosphatase PAP2 family protein, partial [Rickettsiales bacterium]|nr:phosphatase PAP2 family protein [Rickettsiales bacterium]
RKFRSPDIFPPRQMAANRLIWMALMVTCGIDLAIINFAQLSLVVAYAPVFVYIFATCALISLLYRYVMHEKALFMFGETLAQTICTSFVIMITVLLGARLGLPLTDDVLVKIDRFLGFDWYAHAEWLAEQPGWFNEFLKFCYQSYGMQAVILIPALFIRGHSDQGQRFVMVFFITGMITALFATLLPAEAMFIHFHVDPSLYPNMEPAAALLHERELNAMRNATTSVLVYPGMGIVTFPSFHTVMAIILMYASIPLPLMRLWAIPVNLGMIFSTPFHGGHYLIDVVAGLVIGFFGVYFAENILPPRSQEAGVFLNQLGSEADTSPRPS